MLLDVENVDFEVQRLESNVDVNTSKAERIDKNPFGIEKLINLR